MMRYIGFFRKMALLFMLASAVSCDVHEWPEAPEKEQFVLKLIFDTDFIKKEYECTGSNVAATGIQSTTDGELGRGYMHYVVRAFPMINGVPQQRYFDEFVFSRSVMLGYDCELPVDLAPGNYRVMIWSYISEQESGRSFYDSDDFGDIRLWGTHVANTDYRDAFRGTTDILVESHISTHISESQWVMMERPLSKYEFVATDLQAFLQKHGGSADDYEAVIRYTAFMPCAYSIYIDKPVDSSTGVSYRSILRAGSSETSLGFDYVFVNGTESAVTVQIEFHRRSDDSVLSRTSTVRVPLRRGVHTLIRGPFFMGSTGGVGVNPGYDGDNNIFIN